MASEDGTARLWELLPLGDELWSRTARMKLRDLTEEEKRAIILID